MRTRASKAASKMHCTCSLSWGRPARSYLMDASAVPSGRCGIASCPRRWVSFSSKSATPLGEGRGCVVGRMGRGQEGAHDSAGRVTSQSISIGAAERCWKVYACAHSLSKRLGPERAPKLVRVHHNLLVCAVSEVIRSSKTCICPQRRLIRSKKQRMTSLWTRKMTQISKLKAGSLVMRRPS
jgi:hypothetical protein